MPFPLFQSIRWRVQAWHGAILFFAIAALSLSVHRLAWDGQFRRIDAALFESGRNLGRALFDSAQPEDTASRPPPDVLFFNLHRQGRLVMPPSLKEIYANTAPGYYWFSLRDTEGNILLQSPNAPDGIQPPPVASTDNPEKIRTRGSFRETYHQFGDKLFIVFGYDLSPDFAESRRFAWSLAACGLAVWLLGLLGGWWLAGRAIRPIRNITGTAVRIAEGSLAERINTSNTDNELDQLGRVLNQTFDRLHASIERQRRFTADASHELRTPVAILIAETQRILKRERSPAEYRESLQTCADTATRMRHLIESLLILARQEATDAPAIKAGPIDLADILRDASRHLAPLADARGLRIHTDALLPAPCQADPALIGILAQNLLTNAIQHHHAPPEGGNIHLATALHPTPDGRHQATFTIRDDGPGIPPEDLPHIFERFYRADKVRTHSTSIAPHAGLGLAIAQVIVANHHGTLHVDSQPGQGAAFTVKLPT